MWPVAVRPSMESMSHSAYEKRRNEESTDRSESSRKKRKERPTVNPVIHVIKQRRIIACTAVNLGTSTSSSSSSVRMLLMSDARVVTLSMPSSPTTA
jgi:hypothetical protein